ncbi:protein REVEILLE 6 [Sesamum angolense]|uniref:Protein REVEILLE 6 n=1 Tax=Sesamum angolense TaxID=2727404 RepID=A0AAE2BTI3_9LAMI|nr:protein REVEILLE 6 [Sesamum angolense]
MGGDPMKITGVNRSDGHLLLATAVGNVGSAVDDTNKKIRKPYTITKSRESWSEQEHDKFLEALQLFDRDWEDRSICRFKNCYPDPQPCSEIFSESPEKWNKRACTSSTSKRKAAHPYPQKAPKNVLPQANGVLQPSAALESGYAVRPDSLSIPRKTIGSAPVSSWTYNGVPTGCLSHTSKDDTGLANNYSSSSNESTPRVWTSDGTQGNLKVGSVQHSGSVFDPCASDHLQRLKKMEPINIETVLMLMKNLAVNLVSPEFEDHLLIADELPLHAAAQPDKFLQTVGSADILKLRKSSDHARVHVIIYYNSCFNLLIYLYVRNWTGVRLDWIVFGIFLTKEISGVIALYL